MESGLKSKKKEEKDPILQSMSAGVKQTLAEFGLLEQNLSDIEDPEKERKDYNNMNTFLNSDKNIGFSKKLSLE